MRFLYTTMQRRTKNTGRTRTRKTRKNKKVIFHHCNPFPLDNKSKYIYYNAAPIYRDNDTTHYNITKKTHIYLLLGCVSNGLDDVQWVLGFLLLIILLLIIFLLLIVLLLLFAILLLLLVFHSFKEMASTG
jgi:hypothetical protein